MTAVKTEAVDDLVLQLEAVRAKLVKERQRLLARVAVIDNALEGKPAKAAAKGTKAPRAPKAGGIRDAVALVLAGRPGLTIRDLQQALAEHSATSVEATVRAMAAEGTLNKDRETPRHFSLPSKVEREVARAAGGAS